MFFSGFRKHCSRGFALLACLSASCELNPGLLRGGATSVALVCLKVLCTTNQARVLHLASLSTRGKHLLVFCTFPVWSFSFPIFNQPKLITDCRVGSVCPFRDGENQELPGRVSHPGLLATGHAVPEDVEAHGGYKECSHLKPFQQTWLLHRALFGRLLHFGLILPFLSIQLNNCCFNNLCLVSSEPRTLPLGMRQLAGAVSFPGTDVLSDVLGAADLECRPFDHCVFWVWVWATGQN